MPYEYNATVTSIVDGDTVVVDIDLGFNIKFQNQKVRLMGIDTPESRTSDKIEKQFGLLSRNYVKKFVDSCDKQVIVRTHISKDVDDDSREKFGRLLGEIINPNTKAVLNDDLILKNYAVKYLGENKSLVSQQHKVNRKILIDRGEIKLTYNQAGVK